MEVGESMAMAVAMVREWIQIGLLWIQQSPPMAVVCSSVVVVFATTLLLFSLGLKLKKPDTILLAGLSGSGKTTLFHQLRDGCCKPKTVQTQEPKEERCLINHIASRGSHRPQPFTPWSKGYRRMNRKVRPVHVVELPEESRLLSKMDRFLRKAAGIVFVVDAAEILWNCQQVSEYLYEILTKAIVVKKKIPVLILCNKTDKLTAHTKEFVARLLEKEIDQLCLSRTGMSETASGAGRRAFSFSDCRTEVRVSEASGLTGEITQLEHFIREHVKH